MNSHVAHMKIVKLLDKAAIFKLFHLMAHINHTITKILQCARTCTHTHTHIANLTKIVLLDLQKNIY